MSQIRSKDTKPELVVRKFLFGNGFRYKLHDKKLPGKPDIVLPKYKSLIFVHGCFWHGHQGCKDFVVPKTKTDWWLQKINRNIELDKGNYIKLKNQGWEVFIIFECDLVKSKITNSLTKVLDRLNEISMTIVDE